MAEPIDRLSERQLAEYERNGFLGIDALTTPREVDGLIAAYDRMFLAGAGKEDGMAWDLTNADPQGEADLPQIIYPSKYEPIFTETRLYRTAHVIAEQILGPEVELWFDHAIYKPPHHGAETPWHQDEAYHDPKLEHDALDIWVPLQDVDESNGCMHFIPGSHRWPVLPHHSIGDDPRVAGLEADPFDVRDVVSCPLRAGGATVHTLRTMHYTPANHSDRPRRAYIMAFGVPARPGDQTREFPWRDAMRAARARGNDE